VPRLSLIPRRLRGADRDRGSVATIVAVLLAGGVLLGLAAFVVDVGTLYTEREELLSGADSAAQTLALDCSRTGGLCGDLDFTRAVTAADSNAKDGLSTVDIICGSESGGRLKSCPAPAGGDYTACLGNAPAGAVNWVEVRTSTLVSGGKTVLPAVFAQTVVPGYAGAKVHACSRVAWGPPAGGLALTISQCEWSKYTSNGTTFAPAPPYPPNPAASFEHVILLHDPNKDNGCGAGPSGWDAPGGFGWTDEPNGDCQTVILAGTYGGNTGNNFPKDCQDVFHDDWLNKTVVLVPIYDNVKGQGANKATYSGGNSAGFVITGYSLGGINQSSWVPGSTATCAKNQSCIFGFFVGGLQLSTGTMPGTGANYGITVLKTIG
jgi:Flp pilus assembly protein TadG